MSDSKDPKFPPMPKNLHFRTYSDAANWSEGVRGPMIKKAIPKDAPIPRLEPSRYRTMKVKTYRRDYVSPNGEPMQREEPLEPLTLEEVPEGTPGSVRVFFRAISASPPAHKVDHFTTFELEHIIIALRRVAETLHKVSAAMGARYLILRNNLTPPMREKLIEQHMVDSEVRDETADRFEDVVLALKVLGDTDVTTFECKAEDIER